MSEDFLIVHVDRRQDGAHLVVDVPSDLRFFEGHFEGRPMLPGIAQVLSLAHRRAIEIFGALGAEKRMSRLKFEAVIHPGDRLDLHLDREVVREQEVQIRFRIERGGARCASGVLVYGAAA